MKKIFLRAILPLLFLISLCFSTFLPYSCVNVLFSYPSLSCPAQPWTGLSKTPITAAAQTASNTPPQNSAYACILTDDVFFYSSADDKCGLFLLPKTYYVHLLEYGEEYCKIEYQTEGGNARRVIGYAKTDQLTFVDYVPARPYLYYVFDVRYKIDAAQATEPFLTEYLVSCTYYGDYLIGSERYCYVLRGEEFGYIPKPSSLSYEENTEYADRLTATQPDTEVSLPKEEVTEKNNSPMQIAILVAICLLVPILAALVVKPQRHPPYDAEE